MTDLAHPGHLAYRHLSINSCIYTRHTHHTSPNEWMTTSTRRYLAKLATSSETMSSYIPGIITGTLPIPFPGPHSVGYATLRHTPHHPYTHPVPRLSSTSTTTTTKDTDGRGIPALGVRQVEYSIYYPCEKPASKGWFWQKDKQGTSVSWLPRSV